MYLTIRQYYPALRPNPLLASRRTASVPLELESHAERA